MGEEGRVKPHKEFENVPRDVLPGDYVYAKDFEIIGVVLCTYVLVSDSGRYPQAWVLWSPSHRIHGHMSAMHMGHLCVVQRNG